MGFIFSYDIILLDKCKITKDPASHGTVLRIIPGPWATAYQLEAILHLGPGRPPTRLVLDHCIMGHFNFHMNF